HPLSLHDALPISPVKPSLYARTCGILRVLALCGSSVRTTNPRSPEAPPVSTTSLPAYESEIDQAHRRASSLGTVFEWYDFYLMTVVIGAFFLPETKDYAVI